MRHKMMRYSLGLILFLMAGAVGAPQSVTRIAVLNNSVQNLALTVTAALPTDFTVEPTPDTGDTVQPQRPLYYTLGGVRLKLAFDATTLTTLERAATPTYSWVMNATGRSCTGFDDTSCTLRAATYAMEGSHEIWWEPENWTIGLNAEAELTISFSNSTVNPDKVIRFRVANRELQPLAAPNTMEGSDVGMLEQMLWQLGYGPNNSSYRGNLSRRKTTDRDTFDVGCSVGGCLTNYSATTSMEWMVWRFKFPNEITTAANVLADDVTLVDTNFDSNSLAVLKEHWQDYFSAYTRHSASQTITAQNQSAYPSWLAASADWDLNGSEVYTPAGVTKSDLLNAMVSKESGTSTVLTSGIHWGSGGSNATPYRLNQGSADSWASFGFSQIKSRYLYGQLFGARNGTDSSRCVELRMANPYLPDIAIASIVKYSMGQSGSCGRSFRLALSGAYDADYTQTDQARIVEILGDSPRTIPDTDVIVLADDYDAVSKAIGSYNQGASVFQNTLSWPNLIKTYSGFVVTTNTPGASPRIDAIEYARRVKQTAGFNLRNYVWQVTETRTPTVGWPATEFSYCFPFGETDWGQLWTDARDTARTTTINSDGATTGCN